jgi:hypothetical protein
LVKTPERSYLELEKHDRGVAVVSVVPFQATANRFVDMECTKKHLVGEHPQAQRYAQVPEESTYSKSTWN